MSTTELIECTSLDPAAGGSNDCVKNLWLTSLITIPCANSACHCCGDTYTPLGGGKSFRGWPTCADCAGSLRNSTCAAPCAGVHETPLSKLTSVFTSKKLLTMYPPTT